MWIEASNGTKQFYDKDILKEPIKFSDNGKAQVSTSEGKKLVSEYDFISKSKSDESKYEKNEVSK